VKAGEDHEHQQRKPRDNSGKNEREKNEPTEEGFAREAGAVEGEGRKQAQSERKCNGAGRNDEAIEDGVPDGAISEELAIPVEGEMLRRKSADTVTIEGIENKHGEREVDESENEHRVECEERRAASWGIAAHLKDQRFSRRSVKKSREMVMSKMPTEMAAPNSQS